MALRAAQLEHQLALESVQQVELPPQYEEVTPGILFTEIHGDIADITPEPVRVMPSSYAGEAGGGWSGGGAGASDMGGRVRVMRRRTLEEAMIGDLVTPMGQFRKSIGFGAIPEEEPLY